MNKWSPHPEDWFEGDPIFDLPSPPEMKGEDAIFATLAEVIVSRREVYLDAWERKGCLPVRCRRDIESIIYSQHESDTAEAMELQRQRWEERKYEP